MNARTASIPATHSVSLLFLLHLLSKMRDYDPNDPDKNGARIGIAGTGGFLSSGIDYVLALNPDATLVPFGQELNPESYAICKGDMLVKNQPVANIKHRDPQVSRPR
jgi:hypothetical protein